ncbi:sigma-70 family RNA polymerase sigma factor [Streptococcus suis]|uniref:Signal transduction histidine kinase n=1 Tax=Streptococcus suis TaxID=1307 RepID=A0A0Z8MCL8_STRSU|nr:sigma-70 family RNA polymerase sigma factor [Streptococcus suis]NQG59464.1 sigma-70 family RNA polymerase sigma factor [Streptococcus suis]NQH18000.1 sigma-70 family RNA polymerase sigma factor [Streptococcus suis]NQJ48158.1 sigma-70 family RNA polymerase sigma factor [Streptococcus suis]NQJ55188.1 sigma-70 family RNA polymerase sigma factor [Streptococcus suis]NQN11892.1 sigma-70 family RNA polymerase sigma factor [Streptococcus suis]
MEFEKVYDSVKGIVNKARKEYYIKLWEKEDWDQEGMMTLFELLEDQPWLADEQEQLYCYFKVKFRNRVKDRVRRQESQKRKFDRMPHEDIHDLSHVIQSPGLVNDELLMLRSALRDYRKNLSDDQLANYEKLISGQSFNGRKNMLRDLQEHLKDFR